MSLLRILFTVSLVLQFLNVRAFVVPHAFGRSESTAAKTKLQLMPSLVDVSNSIWLATVDSDIAKMSENEFAPIFAGGLLVMFGGLVSALVVGTIIDKKDLYASIVADSYAQGAQDEEFWKGLSEEEKKKTKELLQRIKESKEGGSPAKAAAVVSEDEALPAAPATEMTASVSTETSDTDMFSDYADN